jgi:hypothetical protein
MSTFVNNSNITYTGKEVQPLILQTFFEGVTFKKCKKMPRVRTVGKIYGLSATDIMGPAGCDFVEHGETAYDDKEIRTHMVGIAQEICEDELEGMELESILVSDTGAAEFIAQDGITMLNNLYAGKAGEEIEIALWRGNRTGSPTNLLTAVNGFNKWIAASTDVIKVTTPVAIDSSNVVAELGRLVALFPDRLLAKQGMKGYAIQVTPAIYQAYIDARAASPGNPTLFLGPNATAEGQVYYNGWLLERRPGMAANTMVFCNYEKDLIIGTDLEDPKNTWKYVYMADTTADFKVRIVSRWPLGTQIGRDEDIVSYGI